MSQTIQQEQGGMPASTRECLEWGLPVVRFTQSLKVQTQISVAPAGSGADGAAAVAYLLDPF